MSRINPYIAASCEALGLPGPKATMTDDEKLAYVQLEIAQRLAKLEQPLK